MAIKARAHHGIEGKSIRYQKFATEMGSKSSHRKSAPWKVSKRDGRVKAAVKQETAVVDADRAKSMLAKFKRDGTVPPAKWDELERFATKSKEWLRLKRALLLQQGIEPNPGPPVRRLRKTHRTLPYERRQQRAYMLILLLIAGIEPNPGPRCPSSGAWIPCARHQMQCPDCGAECINMKQDGVEVVMFHPTIGADDCVLAGKIIVGEKYGRGKTARVVCTACARGLQCEAGMWGYHPIDGRSTIGCEELKRRVKKLAIHEEKPGTPPCSGESSDFTPSAPPLPPRTPTPEVEPTPPCVSPPVNSEPAPPPRVSDAPRAAVKVEPELRGYILSDDEVELLGEQELPGSMSHVEMKTVDYVVDRRIVANRNVPEVKAPFRAVNLTYTRRSEADYGLVISAVVFSLAYAALNAASSVLPPFMVYSAGVIHPLTVVATMCCSLVVGYACGGGRDEEMVVIPYVPHLVTSVLAEYERGTNAESVRNSVRGKLRRLACFPVADEDYTTLTEGTERVIIFLIERSGFFTGRRAACFGQPSWTRT